jgi:alanyl-tRNA synthetase
MTQLAYMTSPEETTITTTVVDLPHDDGMLAVVLAETPFYPQGGGQPSDVGVIEGDGFTFTVRKAVLIDGTVHHQGVVTTGTPSVGPATATIDADLRATHARHHTGGHLVMTAMHEVTGMRAVKGYHFVDGPYVEFDGVLDDDEKARVAAELDQRLAEMIDADAEISVEETTVAELKEQGVFMPMEIPLDKPTRVVTSFGYRSPCGGTHVKRSSELRGLHVKSVRSKSGRTRVSYEFKD